MPAAIRRPPTDRNDSRNGPSVAVELEQAPEQDPTLGATRRLGEEAVGAPLLLVQDDERLEVRERVGGIVEPDLPDGLGPPDLAPDLVALLLAERGEEVSMSRRRAA